MLTVHTNDGGSWFKPGELIDAHQGNVGTRPPFDDQGLAALGDLVAVALQVGPGVAVGGDAWHRTVLYKKLYQ